MDVDKLVPGTYKHVKSDQIYHVIATDIIDATNTHHGEIMVLYRNPDTGLTFVRNRTEFSDGRFKLIDTYSLDGDAQ